MRSLIHMCTFIACSRPASNLFERLWYGHGTSSIAQTSTPNRFAILIRPRLSVLQRTSESLSRSEKTTESHWIKRGFRVQGGWPKLTALIVLLETHFENTQFAVSNRVHA